MVNLSVVLEAETLEQIKELQTEKSIFSRSELVRLLINEGLKQIDK